MVYTKICQHCGKEYSIQTSNPERSKFCSDACFRKNKDTRVTYKCDYCGKEYLVRKSMIEKRNRGERKYLCCSSECAKNIQKPKWEDIQAAFSERGYILLSEEYVSAKTPLYYICPHHKDMGVQGIRYNNIKNGNGCTYCGDEIVGQKKRLSWEQVKEIYARHDMDLIEGQEYTGTHQNLKYVCRHHPQYGVQQMMVTNAYKQRCPHCRKSRGEAKIAEYLIRNGYQFETQKKYDGLVGLKGRLLSYDFYLPGNNMLIEYQGEFHDGSVSFQKIDEFERQKEHDRRKRDYAAQNGIKLLEIWYSDFNNIENILDSVL